VVALGKRCSPGSLFLEDNNNHNSNDNYNNNDNVLDYGSRLQAGVVHLQPVDFAYCYALIVVPADIGLYWHLNGELFS